MDRYGEVSDECIVIMPNHMDTKDLPPPRLLGRAGDDENALEDDASS